MEKNKDQQLRLQKFWGNAIFSLGVFWGFANLIYCPVAAMTSIAGSSWFEVFVIAAGGALTFCASIGAFYGRRAASRALLSGGVILLFLAIGGHVFLQNHAHGLINLFLLFLSGVVAISLGVFGGITEQKGWPSLRETL